VFTVQCCDGNIAAQAPEGHFRANIGRIEVGIEVGGLVGLSFLIIDIWAMVKIVQSGASTGAKFPWIVIILLLPVAGDIDAGP
jgi:molybdenum cofactor biosynthesis enzyme